MEYIHSILSIAHTNVLFYLQNISENYFLFGNQKKNQSEEIEFTMVYDSNTEISIQN